MGYSSDNRYITDYLEVNAKNCPDKLAIEFEGQQISWSKLDAKVDSFTGYFLNKLGTHEQKIVALLLTNSIEFVTVYLAILKAGHLVMPLDPAYKKLELEAIVEQIFPSLFITSKRYQDQIGGVTETLLVEEISPMKSRLKPLRIGPDKQIASLTFTSGTSGEPKAVPNTHANHIWNIQACSKVWDWTENDTLLVCLPLSHMHGLVICLTGAIYHGNTIYLKQQSFKPKEVFDELASGRISMFTHVPWAYSRLMGMQKTDLSSTVRVLISGAAPLAPAVWQEFKDKFNASIVQTYGSSETGRIAANRLDKQVLGSPGPPLPGVKVRISSKEELLVKSPGLFPGYYKNHKITRQSTAPDGFWHTGDLAEIRDGNIFLKGRLKERIRRFGYTVSPRDVEWAMLKHPSVSDIFVMGEQTTDSPNDELIYFIVTTLSDKEIADYCKANLLFAWRPDRVIRLDSLPRNHNGKTSLPQLKRLMEQLA